MNVEKLNVSTPVCDFEYFIDKEVQNLERYAAQMRSMRAKIVDHTRTSARNITDDDILMGFYFHLESLKSLIGQMKDTEEYIQDMEDDEVEQAYARGELSALKKGFATLAKQVYLSVEKWINTEANSGRFGRPELHREIFYTASSRPKSATPHPLMFKPFDFVDSLPGLYARP